MSRATLPWAELEAEARRQGCSVADVFFDRAGRTVPGLSIASRTPCPSDSGRSDSGRKTPAFERSKPTYDTWGRPT